MTIVIEDLEFKAIIGILEEERVTPQRVILNLEISYQYKNGKFINYAEVCQMLKDLFITKKFGILEDASIEMFKILKSAYPPIEHIKTKITKPDILFDANVGIKDQISFNNL